MKRIILGSVRKFGNAFKGLYLAWKSDLSIRIEILGLVPLLGIVWYFWPIESYEIMALTISYGLLLLTELINTSLEAALDKLHPMRHHAIGLSKDIAASAVFVALLVLTIVLGVIILNHI
jgi:diacylglycerol kinase (ATP)